MSSQYFAAVESRRSIYALSSESPISDSRIQKIIEATIKHTPSSYNTQSARAVILFGEQHKKLWQLASERVKAVMPEHVWTSFEGRMKGFAGAHGTVLFFEDQIALEGLRQKSPSSAALVPEHSSHSAGMHQLVAWTALSSEGFGANLQHFNGTQGFEEDVKKMWSLPESWTLNAQLVFGKPTAGPQPKQFKPLEERIRVFA